MLLMLKAGKYKWLLQEKCLPTFREAEIKKIAERKRLFWRVSTRKEA